MNAGKPFSSELSPETPVTAAFWRNVFAAPHHTALFIKDTAISYLELGRLVKAVHALIPRGTKRIGLVCNRDMHTYASLLAANLAGAAFVPLHPDHPPARNQAIAEEAGIERVLDSREHPPLVPGTEIISSWGLPAVKELMWQEPEDLRKSDNLLAYILFTSGSSGIPKGVPVYNRQVLHFLHAFSGSGNYGFSETDRFLQGFDLSFDASLQCLLLPLSLGASAYVPPDSSALTQAAFAAEHGLTVLTLVPSALAYLARYSGEIHLPEVRHCFFGGEALRAGPLKQWWQSIPNASVTNLYGPTECTIWCSSYSIASPDTIPSTDTVPIGKLFEGHSYFILKSDNSTEGELCICGPQVFEGYTDSRLSGCFITHAGQRYYKTGDTVKELEDGNLLFTGRNDSQIKLNGYRISPEEIEAHVSRFTGRTSIVTLDSSTEPRLICYCLGDESPEGEAIQAYLETRLPSYMIPRSYKALNQFPQTRSGKTDRNQLHKTGSHA